MDFESFKNKVKERFGMVGAFELILCLVLIIVVIVVFDKNSKGTITQDTKNVIISITNPGGGTNSGTNPDTKNSPPGVSAFNYVLLFLVVVLLLAVFVLGARYPHFRTNLLPYITIMTLSLAMGNLFSGVMKERLVAQLFFLGGILVFGGYLAMELRRFFPGQRILERLRKNESIDELKKEWEKVHPSVKTSLRASYPEEVGELER